MFDLGTLRPALGESLSPPQAFLSDSELIN